MPVPKLVVFDLDFTLWDCGGLWIDCTAPPFRVDRDGRVCDRTGRTFRLYPDVTEILDEVVSHHGCALGLASRTDQPSWAREVLDLMGIRSRFDFEEIYPGSKVEHFSALAEASGYRHEEMLFFDDEHRNIVEVGELGVTCVHVNAGVDRAVFVAGMERCAGEID